MLSDMFRVTCQGGHVERQRLECHVKNDMLKSKYVESDMSSDMSRVRYHE